MLDNVVYIASILKVLYIYSQFKHTLDSALVIKAKDRTMSSSPR